MPDTAQPVNSSATDPTDLVSEAIRHVNLGFAVLAVWPTTADGVCMCPKGRDCQSKPGKHPATLNGLHDASTDEANVRTMLAAGGRRNNYGLVWPEDAPGRVIFIDVDGEGWRERLRDLAALYGPLPRTKTTRTPGGGLHLFYQWPVEGPIPSHLHGFLVRSPGKGYVVGPGSRINGTTYQDAGIDDIAILPREWAVNPVQPKRTPLITVTDDSGYVLPDKVLEGSRHDEITRYAGSLIAHKRTDEEIDALVRTMLVPRFAEPIEEARLRHEIEHAISTARDKVASGAWEARDPTTGSVEGATTSEPPETRGRIEVGLPGVAVPAMPAPMRREAFTASFWTAALLHHWEPRTDAAPEGLLVASLTFLSALVGRTPSVTYGSKQHRANVFSVLVGPTTIGRKGTTTDLVRGVMGQVTDLTWKIKTSPNSGEGLIARAAKADGLPLLVEEEEFARLMAAKGREQSTLSHILRQAFDGGSALSSDTSTRQVYAAKHHVALFGNVTREEIVLSMDGSDIKNGFANRLLWCAVTGRPGHTITIHDNVPDKTTLDYLRDGIGWAHALATPLIGGTTHRFAADALALIEDARQRYLVGIGIAPFLSRRLDTIAARLALLFAVMDQTREIDLVHAEAAVAITDYAWASAQWVFPETTGDADADLLLRYLKEQPDGFMSMTEIEAVIGKRTKDKVRAGDALRLMGYARDATRPRVDGKAGRPRQGLELIS